MPMITWPKSILMIVNNLFFNDYYFSEVAYSRKYSKSYVNSQNTSNEVKNIEKKDQSSVSGRSPFLPYKLRARYRMS